MTKLQPITGMGSAFSVKGQNVIVTGGNRGIGYGISTAFAQSGANVAILCRNKQKGDEAAESLQQYGGKYICVQCDTSDFTSVINAVDAVYKAFGEVNTLVNNAGVSTVTKFLDDTDLIEWYRVVNTNLHGPAHMIYAVAPRMAKAGKGGSIVNISSIGGQSVGGTRHHPKASYHASKAALEMLTKALTVEFGDDGIRLNVIEPGPTHSDLDKDLPPEAFKEIEANMPLHRFGEPIEIGAYCVFLSSPAASQITGTINVHDGGLVLGG